MAISYPLAWPNNRLGKAMTPVRGRPRLRAFTQSGPLTFGGRQQISQIPAWRWEARLTFDILDETTLLNWSAFVTQMNGRAGYCLIPGFVGRTAPWPLRSDGRATPARSGFEDMLDLEPDGQIVVACRSASAGAYGVTLDVTQAGALKPGMRFSLDASQYEITTVSHSGSVWTVGILPPLRGAVAGGTAAVFHVNFWRARFLTDDEGALDPDLGQFGPVTASFVEYLS